VAIRRGMWDADLSSTITTSSIFSTFSTISLEPVWARADGRVGGVGDYGDLGRNDVRGKG
jgi:hypothetical protein